MLNQLTLCCAESFPWVLSLPHIPILLAPCFSSPGWRSQMSFWQFPFRCSSTLACSTTAVAAVTPPLQDLGQPTTSAVPASVYHGGWIHPALQPLLCAGRRAPASNWPASSAPQGTCWKRCEKPFSELWISRTQLIYCPLSWMHDNTKVTKNYSLSSFHPSKI